MKKTIFTAFAVIAMVTANAQQIVDARTMTDSDTDTRSKFILGAKLGINYSNVYDSEGQDFVADPKLGLVAGSFVTCLLYTSTSPRDRSLSSMPYSA